MKKLNIGKIKVACFLIVIILSFNTMIGEDRVDSKEEMMEIMLNDDFIFGEGVSDDKEIAYGIALDDLLLFANEIKDRHLQEKLTMSDLLTKTKTLVYENGKRYEVLVYIPFKIVIDTNHNTSSAKNEILITKSGFRESVEEPEVRKEPEPVIEPQPVIEPGPVIADEPVAVPEPISPPVIQAEKESTTIVSRAGIEEIEGFILTQDNFSEIKSFLSEMKHSGRIRETGASESPFNLPEDASLILLDELGGILAVLSPAGLQGRINCGTHGPDSVNNYNSKFIVWYRK